MSITPAGFLKKCIRRLRIGSESDNGNIGAFISIPKNGTYTVKKILKLNKDSDRAYGSTIISKKHQRGAVLQKKYRLKDLFVFCFVRNPYDRVISWYEYHKERKLEPYASLTFEEWVQEGLPHHWDILKGTDWGKENLSPLLQYNFVNECKVDFVGRTDHFERDMKKVIHSLNTRLIQKGLEPDFEYLNIRHNTSRRSRKTEEYYTPELKEIVRKKLHPDFEHFGFEK